MSRISQKSDSVNGILYDSYEIGDIDGILWMGRKSKVSTALNVLLMYKIRNILNRLLNRFLLSY